MYCVAVSMTLITTAASCRAVPLRTLVQASRFFYEFIVLLYTAVADPAARITVSPLNSGHIKGDREREREEHGGASRGPWPAGDPYLIIVRR